MNEVELRTEMINKEEIKTWCIFWKGMILLQKQPNEHGEITYRLPIGIQPPIKPAPEETIHHVRLTDESKVWAFALTSQVEESNKWKMIELRDSYKYLSLSAYKAAGKAFQILYWDEHSRFCPVCGTCTERQTDIMKKCPACGNELFPPISTAIIVLIRKGKDEILLVRARNFRGTFYGLVAGFLETGETLEECVQREVMEETGLKVKNIQYFASQSWPYPSGLMVGFFADYDSGEIKLQEDELTTATFFHRNNLPELPRKLSIARKLIDHWLEN